jgi:hypothetical protein
MQRRDGSANSVALLSSGAKQRYEVWPLQLPLKKLSPRRRRLRNLSVPTQRSLKTDGSIPEG